MRNKTSTFSIKTGSVLVLLQAMLELQAKGKFKFSNIDPVFMENISFIMGFLDSFLFQKNCIKASLILVAEFSDAT